MNADQYVTSAMNSESRNGYVEIITGEPSRSAVDAVETWPRTGCDFAECAQYRNCAIIAGFHQTGQKSTVVAADVQAMPRLALNLSAPAFVNCDDRPGAVDKSDLFHQSIDDFLYFIEIKGIAARRLLPPTYDRRVRRRFSRLKSQLCPPTVVLTRVNNRRNAR